MTRRIEAVARFGLLACLVAVAGACSLPTYGDGRLQCASVGRACPDDFYCSAADQRCWRTGSGPDLAPEPTSDLATSSTDLAGADLGVPASLCPVGVKLCDGFEAATLDARWQKGQSSGVVALDTTRSYRGQSSVHVHTNAVAAGLNDVDATIVASTPLPLTGTVYTRVWLYLKTPQPATTGQIVNFLDSNMGGMSYVVESGGKPGINDYAAPVSYAASSTTTVPFDRWTCLQMQIAQTGATGNISISVDGTLVADAMLTGATTPALTRVAFGLDYYQPPAIAAQDAWIDEIIVDDKPISCSD
ncbi:MAG: hypothetical protein JWN44_3333 [Myxococcales bacterium]|nr:hypothetical protein [Myxococcales bacterium]